VQRHLAALEALDAHAGARGLALAAAAAGLAGAGADAAADARTLLARARPIRKFVQFHRRRPLVPMRAGNGRPPILVLADHAHEVTNLRDHAARRRRVGNIGGTADAVELQPDQGCALGMVTADGTADLLDLDHFVGFA